MNDERNGKMDLERGPTTPTFLESLQMSSVIPLGNHIFSA